MIYPQNFLSQLYEHNQREVYARITALNFQEEPLEQIEGRITQGSINIDGSSAVRRSCSLTMVAQNIDFTSYYWGFKNKIQLEIGLKNYIDNNYEDTIWFPQGIYIINTFNISQNVNSFTISINGKDKMCLLNGDLGGSLTSSIDFGTMEDINTERDEVVKTDLPIKNIIREALHTWGREDYHNIIINDLEEAALELLEYRGDVPLYLMYNVNQDRYTNFTLDETFKCYYKNDKDEITEIEISEFESQGLEYDSRVNLDIEGSGIGSEVYLDAAGKYSLYKIAKVTYGQTVGYRATDLTYAGDLISNVGESLTSVLDKIVKMLGNYEYFYDLKGRFIFQKKKAYDGQMVSNLIQSDTDNYITSLTSQLHIAYSFVDGKMFTSFANNPALNNVKNDFSIWGKRKTLGDVEVLIHYRLAIDKKPLRYKTFDDKEYISSLHPDKNSFENVTICDWREIIYQMAQDYYKNGTKEGFEQTIWKNNVNDYIRGKTGYEQYYTDILGFWRQLYSITPDENISYTQINNDSKELQITKANGAVSYEVKSNIYLDTYFTKFAETEGVSINYTDLYIIHEAKTKPDTENNNNQTSHTEILPLIETFPGNLETFEASFLSKTEKDEQYNPKVLEKSSIYYIPDIKSEGSGYRQVLYTERNFIDKEELYVQQNGNYISIYQYLYNYYKGQNKIFYTFVQDRNNPQNFGDYLKNNPDLNPFYVETKTDENNATTFYLARPYLTQHYIDKNGWVITALEDSPKKVSIRYYIKSYDYFCEHDFDENETTKKEQLLYWNKQLFNEPSSINFWFDFINTDSEIGRFAPSLIGNRTKVINDDNVKAIYFRAVPNLIFALDGEELSAAYSSYTKVNLTAELNNLLSVSGQGKSAKEVSEELLYQHSYCTENVTISSVPIYDLEPNNRIYIKDNKSKIDGEYIVTKLSIPLAYSGIMQITAHKAPPRLY